MSARLDPDEKARRKSENAKRWYQKNKDEQRAKARARSRVRRQTHPEYGRVYYLANRTELLNKEHIRRHKDPRRCIYFNAKSSALKKDLEFNLEIADIVIPEYCPLLGLKLVWEPIRRQEGIARRSAHASIDRIDNTKGYVKGNVWVISWRANMIKRDATLDELQRVAAGLALKILG